MGSEWKQYFDNAPPACKPRIFWTDQDLKAQPVSRATKDEAALPGVESEIGGDTPLTAMAKKNQMLEKKVRKLRGRLRRQPASRTMTDRQYKRLVAKTGGRVGKPVEKTVKEEKSVKMEEASGLSNGIVKVERGEMDEVEEGVTNRYKHRSIIAGIEQ